MIGFEEMLVRFRGLERGELVRWVENRWVLPERHADSWVFHEVDVARVELILDLRRDLAIAEDDAMELVLGLVDQLYGLRRQMRRLCDAVARQPPEVQDAIRRALPRRSGPRR
ncbi:MAG TPA: chaperone modulator CbpM [Stellaceae bacterium]|nr:chaperone modulator CbpM [Stellaceae bacterium]